MTSTKALASDQSLTAPTFAPSGTAGGAVSADVTGAGEGGAGGTSAVRRRGGGPLAPGLRPRRGANVHARREPRWLGVVGRRVGGGRGPPAGGLRVRTEVSPSRSHPGVRSWRARGSGAKA